MTGTDARVSILLQMRPPDLIIGPRDNPQTLRYHIFKWRGFQLALHKWLRSDDDRALHDHSSWNVSFILNGGYWELVREICRDQAWCNARSPVDAAKGSDGVWRTDRWHYRRPWRFYSRPAAEAHRIVIPEGSRPVWTIWFRGRPFREWGFHCPKGWRHWKEYRNTRDYSTPGSASETGRGCD